MSQSLESEFGRLRSYIWPIRSAECRKLIPMVIMGFFICFNYSLLRNMKDAVVVTAAGAEVIPFIKVWTMLPCAILITLLYAFLTNIFSQERVFYMMITGFLSFFALFAFVLYPNCDRLHCDLFADYLMRVLPSGSKGIVEMIRYWSFTAFYVVSELWGSMMLSVIFWGFANEVTKVHEAKRFYAVLGVAGNLAAMASGFFGNYFSHGSAEWHRTFNTLMGLIIASGILTMVTFYWMNKRVLNHEEFDEFHQTRRDMKAKKKMSMRESFSFLSNSRYLVCIAVIVMAYNLGINIVEVVWKDRLKALCPSPSDYNNFMNNLNIWMGAVSTILALFMAKIITRFGWTFTAMISPVTMLVTSMGFFLFLYFQNTSADAILAFTGMTPLTIAVFFGAAQNCLSKAAKYSVFDATTQMAFIPLSHEFKLKGKAAIDGVCSRLGKSGGSLIHQGMLIIFHTVLASSGYVAAILFGVIGFWLAATKVLGREFGILADKSEQEHEQEKRVKAEGLRLRAEAKA